MGNFYCRHCSGMGYKDYPSNKIPCHIEWHVQQAKENELQVTNLMKFTKRIWNIGDGSCPYCNANYQCIHWSGLGWTRNKRIGEE